MKEKEFTTVFDERYYHLINMKGTLKKVKINYKDYLMCSSVTNRPPGKEPHMIGILIEKDKFRGIESIILNKDDIRLLNVLIHLFVNSDEEKIVTDFYTIWHEYLGEVISQPNSYSKFVKSLKKLTELSIYDGTKEELTSKSGKIDKLITLNIKGIPETKLNCIIEYSLGIFGNTIRKRRRFSDLLPIMYIRTKRVLQFDIALSICRYLYINNKKKNRTYSVKLKTLLANICYFDKFGNNTAKTYSEVLKDKKTKNKTYILKTFIKSTCDVLDSLIRNDKIRNYSIENIECKPSMLDYIEYEILIEMKS